LNLLPKDEKFFEYFHQQSAIICEASNLLLSGLRGGYAGMTQVSKRMEELERSSMDLYATLRSVQRQHRQAEIEKAKAGAP